MKEELIIEEGIVSRSLGKYSEIILKDVKDCTECSARLICKPTGGDTKIIIAHDPYGALPGDKVKIAVSGSSILKSAFLLYGLPVLIFVISIIAAFSFEFLFRGNELISFLFAVLTTATYYILFSLASKKFFHFSNPKIISVSRSSSNN
ncbi:SoxR reducing system RseC family protein [Melioribacter sp. OK-6-Me]|uniref:SoxR reducing system RseC family protein n=1 Tax=unclassified Melioribacter TaxID=2627329 RepID=UPI003ED9249C